jgi:hypothetical protein
MGGCYPVHQVGRNSRAFCSSELVAPAVVQDTDIVTETPPKSCNNRAKKRCARGEWPQIPAIYVFSPVAVDSTYIVLQLASREDLDVVEERGQEGRPSAAASLPFLRGEIERGEFGKRLAEA